MDGKFLKNTLNDRLEFYATLMERLNESIEAEDTERVEYYQGLEQETLRGIVNIEKCITALSTPSLPLPESTRKEELALDRKVAQARQKALEATRCNCLLLRKQLHQLQGQIAKVRIKRPPASYLETVPTLVDVNL